MKGGNQLPNSNRLHHWRMLNTARDITAVATLIHRQLEQRVRDEMLLNKILVCITEALNNVVQHSGLKPGQRHVSLTLRSRQRAICVQIRDGGRPYRPPCPDNRGSIDENGRGWLILREWTDRVAYHRRKRINRLSLYFNL